MSIKTLASLMLCAAACTCVAQTAWAQDYPSKPIRLVVPFPAGSATDVVARIIAPPLSAALGQSVVIDNKPGADGAIAATQVVKSPADGYTLLLATNSPLAQMPLLRKTPPYDPVTDFTPISFIGYNTFYLVVHPEVPATTIAELIEYGRANPQKLNYATGNTTGILSTAQLMAQSGLKMEHVPYKGEPPAMADLLDGRIQLMFGTSSTTLAFIRENKLRALATTNMKRTAQLPQVPTMAEAGVRDFFIGSWAALVGPARMPRDIVLRIGKELAAVMQRPDVARQFEQQAFAAAPSTSEELGTLIKDQIEVSRRAIAAAGLKPE